MDIVLQLQHISKRFGSVQANDDVSLTLHRGEVLALLGENGSGKTTLMNILFGHYVADRGSITVSGHPLSPGSPKASIQAGIGMVHQHFTLADNLTVLDNLILGTESLWQPWQQRKRARQRLLDLAQTFGLEINPDAKVGDLSVGERQRVEILKALYRDIKILILDEPTAVLTPQETEALFATLDKMTEAGLSIVFISHKLQEVMAVSDRIVVLRAGKVVADVATAATNPAQLAEWMVGHAVPKTFREPLEIGDRLLDLQQMSVTSSTGRPLLSNINLTVHQHEIVGIAGVSGNGQVALFDLISGLVQPTSGHMHFQTKVMQRLTPAAMIDAGVGRIPEDRHTTGLVGDLSIWENFILDSHHLRRFSRLGWLNLQAARQHATHLIQTFDVRCPSPQTRIRLLSGGNMQKVILGRELARSPQLILASQPTRGLDLNAVAYVHQQLLNARLQGAGILLFSEDLEELLSLSDRVHVLYKGQLSAGRPIPQVSLQSLGLMMAGKSTEHPHAA